MFLQIFRILIPLQSQECEDLVALVRELTASRSQLTAFKAVQSERFEDLQQEYLRVLRIVELSRAISKENLAKTAQTMSKLNQVCLLLALILGHFTACLLAK